MNDGGVRTRAKGGISRRDFLKIGGAGIAGAALTGVAGCGGGGQAGAAKEIVFSSSIDDTGTAKKLVDRFNRQNRSGIKVEFRPGDADTGTRFDKMRTQFQAGGEDLDVILGDVIWTAQFAEQGWISDLSDRFTEDMRADYLPGSVEAVTYEGKVYGKPWFTDTGLLYYRKDLLEENGFSDPPKTWAELKRMTQEVRRGSGTRFGYVFQGANYEGGVCNGLEFIWTHGGEALDPEDATKVLIGEPEAVAGLAAYRSMISDGVSPEAMSVYKEDESAGAFLRGDAVFMRNWPYVYGVISDPEQSEVTPEQVGVAELPSSDGQPGNGTVGDQPFYIGAFSEKADASWEFIQWMTAPEQQEFRATEGSYLPTLNALYEDEGLRERVPMLALARSALQHTKPRPVSPYYSDMSLEMADQFNACLKGDQSPEDTGSALQTRLEEFIRQGGQA
jgi:multiple sugar transport system substrate-binding protein